MADEALGKMLSDLQESQTEVLRKHPERRIMYTFTEYNDLDMYFKSRFQKKEAPFVFIMDNHVNFRPFIYLGPGENCSTCSTNSSIFDTHHYGDKDQVTKFVNNFYSG